MFNTSNTTMSYYGKVEDNSNWTLILPMKLITFTLITRLASKVGSSYTNPKKDSNIPLLIRPNTTS